MFSEFVDQNGKAFIAAIHEKRQAEARQVYERLKAIPWNELTRADQRVMLAVGYLCLETDSPLAEVLDYDLSEASHV